MVCVRHLKGIATFNIEMDFQAFIFQMLTESMHLHNNTFHVDLRQSDDEITLCSADDFFNIICHMHIIPKRIMV